MVPGMAGKEEKVIGTAVVVDSLRTPIIPDDWGKS